MAMQSACHYVGNQSSSTWFSPDFNFLHLLEHINSEKIPKCLLISNYMVFSAIPYLEHVIKMDYFDLDLFLKKPVVGTRELGPLSGSHPAVMFLSKL